MINQNTTDNIEEFINSTEQYSTLTIINNESNRKYLSHIFYISIFCENLKNSKLESLIFQDFTMDIMIIRNILSALHSIPTFKYLNITTITGEKPKNWHALDASVEGISMQIFSDLYDLAKIKPGLIVSFKSSINQQRFDEISASEFPMDQWLFQVMNREYDYIKALFFQQRTIEDYYKIQRSCEDGGEALFGEYEKPLDSITVILELIYSNYPDIQNIQLTKDSELIIYHSDEIMGDAD